MRSRNAAAAALLSLMVITNIICIRADEGRIPVFAPGALAAPGRYQVTANLAVAGGSVISITSDDVDLDLNGFTLSSTDAAPIISAVGVNGLSIRNGTLVGGSRSLELDDCERVVVEDIQSVAGAAAGAGLVLDGSTQFSLRRLVVRGWSGLGILVEESPVVAAPSGTIADSLIENCGSGIEVSSAGPATPANVAIQNNRLRGMALTGILYGWGAGCFVSENTLEGMGNYGMFLTTSSCRIDSNVISNTGPGSGFGIQQNGDDNLIVNNVVALGAGRGFGIFGTRNHIEGNVANNNTSFGFHIGAVANIYRRNTARGNTGVAGAPPACGAPCSPDLCVSVAPNSSAGDNFLPGPPAFPACV